MKEINIIEKLKITTQREKKRREQAENYLKKLIKILAPELEEILGNNLGDYFDNHTITIKQWNKEKKKYSYNDLYFRFGEYKSWNNGNCNSEYEGFYIDEQRYKELWGTNILELKGIEFWYRIKQITDWSINYLPKYIEEIEKSRKQRFKQLTKIVNAISEIQM
jgi:hypothetical protein